LIFVQTKLTICRTEEKIVQIKKRLESPESTILHQTYHDQSAIDDLIAFMPKSKELTDKKMESSLRLLTKNLDAAHSDVISRRFQPLFTEFSSKYPEPFLKIDLLNEQLKKDIAEIRKKAENLVVGELPSIEQIDSATKLMKEVIEIDKIKKDFLEACKISQAREEDLEKRKADFEEMCDRELKSLRKKTKIKYPWDMPDHPILLYEVIEDNESKKVLSYLHDTLRFVASYTEEEPKRVLSFQFESKVKSNKIYPDYYKTLFNLVHAVIRHKCDLKTIANTYMHLSSFDEALVKINIWFADAHSFLIVVNKLQKHKKIPLFTWHEKSIEMTLVSSDVFKR